MHRLILYLVLTLLALTSVTVKADGGATGTSCGGCLCKPALVDGTVLKSGASSCW